MARNRLTSRMRNSAEQTPPYPGNVNQPDRSDPSWDEYHTFEQTVNYELPDMRHEWKKDSRDEIGFGNPDTKIPTTASVRVAASKAVRMAVLLLGDKVEDDVIEAQARDFMAMKQTAMDRTLNRFAETQSLYAQDEDEEDDEKCEKKAGEMPPQFKENAEKKKEEAKEDKKDDKKEDKKEAATVVAEDKKEEVKEVKEVKEEKKEASTVVAEEKSFEASVEARLSELRAAKAKDVKAQIEAEAMRRFKAEEEKTDKKEEVKEDKKEAAAAEDKKEEVKEVKEEKKEAAAKVAEEDEDEDEDDEDEDGAKKEAKMGEMDIELTSSMGDDAVIDPVATRRLSQALFADEPKDDDKKEEKVEKTASKKAGIKKLGGQPKVAASTSGANDLDGLWKTAPDVSEVFG